MGWLLCSRPGELPRLIVAGSTLWENKFKKMNLIEYWMCLNILRKHLDNWRVCEDKLVMNI